MFYCFHSQGVNFTELAKFQVWFNSTRITKFTEGCILNHLDLLRIKASDTWLHNPNCSSRSRNYLWGSEWKLHLSNQWLVMELQYFREDRVGGRKSDQNRSSKRRKKLSSSSSRKQPLWNPDFPKYLVIASCLLPSYAVTWTSLSCFYPTSVSLTAVWDRAFLKAKGNGEEKCLVAEEKWDLNGAEKVRIPSVSLSCC